MRLLLVVAASLVFSLPLSAQKKPAAKAPVKGKTAVKKKTSTAKSEFPELICYEDGPCTFSFQKGDTLVYEMNNAGSTYNLFVVPAKFTPGVAADFNWFTTGAITKKGHVVISSTALKSSRNYINFFQEGEVKLTDASAIWLCDANFSDLSKKETVITIDNGKPEVFKSPEEGDAVSAPVTYKGKPIEVEGFAIESKPDGAADRKEIWIMNISDNLIMFKITAANFTMQLKEVRQKKTVTATVKKKV